MDEDGADNDDNDGRQLMHGHPDAEDGHNDMEGQDDDEEVEGEGDDEEGKL